LSGVFNWSLEGLKRLLSQKNFTHSAAVNTQIEDYKRQSDSVQMFLKDENYSPSVNEYNPLKEFFNEYRTYCSESQFRCCSIKTFSDRLKKLDFVVERKNYGNAVFAKKTFF
jgi:putative DNA primase/helicase